MKIKSLKENIELKEFIYSSEYTKDNYEKLYILEINNEKEIKDEIPYIINMKGKKEEINGTNIEIPKITKYIGVYDKKEDIIYTEGDIYILLKYEEDLYKLNKEINNIKKLINSLSFNLIDKVLNILNGFNTIIYEYEKSINIVGDEKLKEIIKNINENIKNIQETVIMKGTYLDMKTTRILTIVTLITFPILILTSWFGTNFPKNQMKFMMWEYSYMTLLIICIIFIILFLYIFRNDLRILLI